MVFFLYARCQALFHQGTVGNTTCHSPRLKHPESPVSRVPEALDLVDLWRSSLQLLRAAARRGGADDVAFNSDAWHLSLGSHLGDPMRSPQDSQLRTG